MFRHSNEGLFIDVFVDSDNLSVTEATLENLLSLKDGSFKKPVVVHGGIIAMRGMVVPGYVASVASYSLTRHLSASDALATIGKSNLIPAELLADEDATARFGVTSSVGGVQMKEDLTVEEFLAAGTPRNLIEEVGTKKIGTKFVLPSLVTDELSLGHLMMAEYGKDLPARFDPTRGISKYLLISDEGCQTNWHQDFTGTAVFYCVLKGEKEFYMAPANLTTLRHFAKYEEVGDMEKVFFPDWASPCATKMVGECYRVNLVAGDCLFIPPLTPHFVYTPHDSVVFGCNFLTLPTYHLSLRQFSVERKARVAFDTTFPDFEMLAVLVLHHLSKRAPGGIVNNLFLDIQRALEADLGECLQDLLAFFNSHVCISFLVCSEASCFEQADNLHPCVNRNALTLPEED